MNGVVEKVERTQPRTGRSLLDVDLAFIATTLASGDRMEHTMAIVADAEHQSRSGREDYREISPRTTMGLLAVRVALVGRAMPARAS